jgi:hypothetical protein
MSFSKIPNDVLRLIICNFLVADAFSLFSVNRRFYQLFTALEKEWFKKKYYPALIKRKYEQLNIHLCHTCGIKTTIITKGNRATVQNIEKMRRHNHKWHNPEALKKLENYNKRCVLCNMIRHSLSIYKPVCATCLSMFPKIVEKFLGCKVTYMSRKTRRGRQITNDTLRRLVKEAEIIDAVTAYLTPNSIKK